MQLKAVTIGLIIAAGILMLSISAHAAELQDASKSLRGNLQKQGFASGPLAPYPGHPGAQSGPLGPEPAPASADEDVLTNQLLSILLGHTMFDLEQGARLYAADPSDKHFYFLLYTVDKVVSTLELDPEANAYTPMMDALIADQRDLILNAVDETGTALVDGIQRELGPEYLWYFDSGAAISQLEYAIWEESHFNQLNFSGKSVNTGISAFPPPPGAPQDVQGLAQLLNLAGGETSLLDLLGIYEEIRMLIDQRYQFPGAGFILW